MLSPETVRTHVRNAMTKLGASTRSQAVAIALRSHEIADQPVETVAAAEAEAVGADVAPALGRLITGLVALYDLDACAAYLADDDGLGLRRAATAGGAASQLPEMIPLGHGALGRVALERRAQLLHGPGETAGEGSLIAAPILADGRMLGLLALVARVSRPAGRTEMLLLQALANHVGEVLVTGGEVGTRLEQAMRRFRSSWSVATRGG